MPETLDLKQVIAPDSLATQIADKWSTWNNNRAAALNEWKEIRQYVFATDTKKTSNSKLPWKNTTTIPKICQIRDNLYANYTASIFPKRKFVRWEGLTQADEVKEKAAVMRDYITASIDQPTFKEEIDKLILDYIDTGNAIATVSAIDNTSMSDDFQEKVGFTGPMPRRINPLDIVFDPTASSFYKTPKITRDLYSMGELKKILESRATTVEMRKVADQVLNDLMEVRNRVVSVDSNQAIKLDAFQVDGFDSYLEYLKSDHVEVLRFYGDLYDPIENKLYENHVIAVVDRAKLVYNEPYTGIEGYAPFFHAGWRKRQDNLWAMSPLANLIGMQYRLDHVENSKADLYDLNVVPPLKIRGEVNEFDWGPMEPIYVGDDGDVEMMAPRTEIIQHSQQEIGLLQAQMEEMAGAPKEAMGFRSPGEKTMYEVQRLENAASRIFHVRTSQFEEQLLEPLLNAMLSLARASLTSTAIRVLDDDRKFAIFKTISSSDLQGAGRIRPIAARHFAEKAQQLQTVTAMYQSALAQDPEISLHLSSEKLGQMVVDLMDVEEYELYEPYIRISERAEAQRLMNSQQESVAIESQTPSGLAEDDADPEALEGEI